MAAAIAYTQVAQELYISYFGRPADTIGLQSMTAALAAADAPTTTAGLDAAYASNTTVRNLLDTFGASAESNALYTSSSAFVTAQFVTAIFHNLFGRDPAQGGLDFWSNAINSGALTRAAAAHSILTGAVVANGADASLIAKKVTVANNFTSAIDTDVEVIAYRGSLAAQTARDLLNGVTRSTDTAAYQANVDASLAKLAKGFALGLGADNLTGTSGDDLFIANILENANALQSGDRISGAGGTDTLHANIGNYQNVGLAVETAYIDNVVIRTQAVASAGEAAPPTQEVRIDAERMVGVSRWESNNSQTDLLIEDVRILDSQTTHDVTVAMVSTASGNVDLGVYFDELSLRPETFGTGNAVLHLQLMNARAAGAGQPPLILNPYIGFQFNFNNAIVKVTSTAIDNAQTYAEFLAAVKAAVAAIPAIQHFEVTLGGLFDARAPQSGAVLKGSEILLTNPGPGIMSLDNTSGWLAGDAVPDAGGTLHTSIRVGSTSTTVLKVASTVLLDDVGRGATGGDLLIGGEDIDDDDADLGVPHFDITVERSSKLQTINSTSNMLEEVILVNGVVKGNLVVNGSANLAPGSAVDQALPGTVTTTGGSQHGDQYGFHDVRLIDGSAMIGKIELSAVITERSIAKYMTESRPTGNPLGSVGFVYTGGANGDTLAIDIDAGVAASHAHRMANKSDFTFKVDGGAGDDLLQVRVLSPADGSGAWPTAQDRTKNIVIDGGNGNDTIRKIGAGDAVITGGAGDDMISVENNGGISNNQIVPGAGNDLVVLGTTVGANPAASSTDTVVYGAAFGSDSIRNFDVSGNGVDHLDFLALGGITLTTDLTTDKSITIVAASAANDTINEIAAFFAADNALAQSHVYAVSEAGGETASIYSIADGAGPGNAVATFQGSIQLGKPSWLTGMTQANFVNWAPIEYNPAEGASGFKATALVLTGIAGGDGLASGIDLV